MPDYRRDPWHHNRMRRLTGEALAQMDVAIADGDADAAKEHAMMAFARTRLVWPERFFPKEQGRAELIESD